MMITLSECFTLKLGVGTPHQTTFHQFVCLTKLTVDHSTTSPNNSNHMMAGSPKDFLLSTGREITFPLRMWLARITNAGNNAKHTIPYTVISVVNLILTIVNTTSNRIIRTTKGILHQLCAKRSQYIFT